MRGDMVVDPVFYCPLVVHDTGFGIGEDVEIVRTDDDNDVVSRGFHAQIDSMDDVEKIRMPVVTYDAEATERNYHCLVDLFGDILPIQKLGQRGFWFAPWDELIRWWDVAEGHARPGHAARAGPRGHGSAGRRLSLPPGPV